MYYMCERACGVRACARVPAWWGVSLCLVGLLPGAGAAWGPRRRCRGRPRRRATSAGVGGRTERLRARALFSLLAAAPHVDLCSLSFPLRTENNSENLFFSKLERSQSVVLKV